MNVSENQQIELDEVREVINEGEMPLPIYTTMHPEARLSDAEKQTLINGLSATFGGATGGYRDGEGEAYEEDEDDD